LLNFESLNEKLRNLIGNIIVCAGIINYLGPFDINYRNELI
jgi:dynein heavy chain